MNAEQTDIQPPQPGTETAASLDDGQAPPIDEIAALRAQIESLEDSLLRSKADFQNLQRRSAAERADAIRYANADLMKSLLGVLDDFDRSLEAAQKSEGDAGLIEGVRLVYANLSKALADFGLETIDARGHKFDPTVHEALLQQPSAEADPGTVLEQVAKGYRLRERVLRPARVIVAKAVSP